MNQPFEINWPDHIHPGNSVIHVSNALAMEANRVAVWQWLIHAPLWPRWYENSSNVVISEEDNTALRLGSVFRWKTFGSTVTCRVTECVENERLAWEAGIAGLNVCHAWLLSPDGEGCHVITEELQRGPVAWLLKPFMRKKLLQKHQLWLEGLEAQAREGLPV